MKTQPEGAGRAGDLAALENRLRSLGRVVVAYSGGVDSAYLMDVAHRLLGFQDALAVTAVSASLAPSELEDGRRLAAEKGWRWRAVVTDEASRPDYEANGADRCYHCKSELMEHLGPIATGEAATVVLGVNLDDLGEHRPGQRAALERGAVFPLVEAGYTKAAVRDAARTAALRVWNKPAAACLASRVPYGTPVTLGTLDRVSRAEEALRAMGFRQLRVRHYGDLARLEVEGEDLARAVAEREEIVAAVKAAGYEYVTLDLEGFRSGNLNSALSAAAAS